MLYLVMAHGRRGWKFWGGFNLKKTIYLISGLGADERVFQNLYLDGWTVRHISWLPPVENEKIEDYALRLTAQIDTPRPVILGVSFGGMIAVEVAKHIDYEQIVLISSVQTYHEIPFCYRLAGRFYLHYLAPSWLLKQANFMTCWFFGMQTPLEKQMLRSILHDTDTQFLKWAMHQIVTWKNTLVPERVTHIHGTNDHILPINNRMRVDYKIERGGHLMVYNRAAEINEILNRLLT